MVLILILMMKEEIYEEIVTAPRKTTECHSAHGAMDKHIPPLFGWVSKLMGRSIVLAIAIHLYKTEPKMQSIKVLVLEKLISLTVMIISSGVQPIILATIIPIHYGNVLSSHYNRASMSLNVLFRLCSSQNSEKIYFVLLSKKYFHKFQN